MTDGEGDDSQLHAEPSSGEPAADGDPATLPALRLRPGGELGRGGMGVVTAAFDPVLERTVAMKRALERGAPGEQRLLREAKLTARLDHPAIVGVLDVGRDEEGRLVAVLPVRAGRSLGEAVAAGAPRPELLRTLLVVAQAVASAHARGVVHRDLSPGNVRLGEEGAVWLIDWGLAATLDEARGGGFAGGTAGFVAPEQRAGRPVDLRGDVWSLGALLHLVCTGAAPRVERTRPASCPRPLWAIAERALRDEVALRYVDAHAFAADLARWLDGQPVEAWPEGWPARLARQARRHPRLATGLVLGLVSVLVATSAAAVLVARAQQQARRATTQLLVESAERALVQDDVATARQLAHDALEVSDALRARGVLATTARVSPVTLTPLDDGACAVLDELDARRLCTRDGRVSAGDGAAVEADDAVLLSRGRWLAVSRARSVVELRDDTGRLMGSAPLAGGVPRVRVSADREVATVTVPELLVVARAGLTTVQPCTPGHAIRFTVTRTERLEVLCADDALVVLELDGRERARRPVLALSTALRGAVAGDALGDDALVVGSANGQLGVLSLDTLEISRVAPTALGLVHTTVAARDGRTVVVVGERGLGVWRVPEGHLLPVARGEAGPDDVRVDDAGFVVRRAGRRWRLDARERLSVASNLHGRSALAVHDGARLVAVGDSVGRVELLSLDTGAVAAARGPSRVIKSLAFSPSGRWLALGAAGPDGVLVFDTTGNQLRQVRGDWEGRAELRGRHVVFLGEDLLLVYSWGPGPWAARWSPEREAFVEIAVPLVPSDVRGVVSDGERVFSLDVTGGWTSLVPGGAGQLIREEARWAPVPSVVAGSPDGRAFVTATERTVERRATQRRFEADAPVESLALARDGRLALCRRDGVVELRGADDQPLLEARSFEGRCGRVVFCDDERALCAVGWDGFLRVIDLGAQ